MVGAKIGSLSMSALSLMVALMSAHRLPAVFSALYQILQRIATTGNQLSMLWLRLTCNIRIVVSGGDNVPHAAPAWFSATTRAPGKPSICSGTSSPASVILKRGLTVGAPVWLGAGAYAADCYKALQAGKGHSVCVEAGRSGAWQQATGVVIYPEGTRVGTEGAWRV